MYRTGRDTCGWIASSIFAVSLRQLNESKTRHSDFYHRQYAMWRYHCRLRINRHTLPMNFVAHGSSTFHSFIFNKYGVKMEIYDCPRIIVTVTVFIVRFEQKADSTRHARVAYAIKIIKLDWDKYCICFTVEKKNSPSKTRYRDSKNQLTQRRTGCWSGSLYEYVWLGRVLEMQNNARLQANPQSCFESIFFCLDLAFWCTDSFGLQASATDIVIRSKWGK